MANKEIPKIPFMGSAFLQDLQKHNLSIRELSKRLGYLSDRQLRHYIKHNEIPEKVLDDIQQILEPRTKVIWMRVGMSIPVSDSELLYIMKVSEEYSKEAGRSDVDINELTATNLAKRGKVEGDCYIPGDCLEMYKDWYEQEKRRGD